MRRRPRRGAGACGAIDPKRGGFGCAIAVTVTSFLPKLGMERLGPRPTMNTKGRKHWTKSWSIGMSFGRRATSWAPLSGSEEGRVGKGCVRQGKYRGEAEE